MSAQAALRSPGAPDVMAAPHAVRTVRLSPTLVHANPFAVFCTATISYLGSRQSHHPQMDVGIFYDGETDGSFAFRFAPDAKGRWVWRTRCEADPGLDAVTGGVYCDEPSLGPSAPLGGLRVDPEHPRSFVWANGARYLPTGLEMDWLFALAMEDRGGPNTSTVSVAAMLDALASHGFNHILAQVTYD